MAREERNLPYTRSQPVKNMGCGQPMPRRSTSLWHTHLLFLELGHTWHPMFYRIDRIRKDALVDMDRGALRAGVTMKTSRTESVNRSYDIVFDSINLTLSRYEPYQRVSLLLHLIYRMLLSSNLSRSRKTKLRRNADDARAFPESLTPRLATILIK